MTEEISFSVLLPVHAAADPHRFGAALESIQNQTLQPSETLVVADGPLTVSHERSIDGARSPVRVERISESRGLANALQTGLIAAQHPWIARMDADDVALPTRFEKQAAIAAEGSCDVIGTAALEFEGAPDRVVLVRLMPQTHDEIAAQMPRSNPMNHPTTFFRRDLALRAGGYRELPGLEDYDFFARMLADGAVFLNLDEPLLLYSGGADLLSRRSLRGMVVPEVRLQRNLISYGLTTPAKALVWFTARLLFRASPRPLKKLAYRRLVAGEA